DQQLQYKGCKYSPRFILSIPGFSCCTGITDREVIEREDAILFGPVYLVDHHLVTFGSTILSGLHLFISKKFRWWRYGQIQDEMESYNAMPNRTPEFHDYYYNYCNHQNGDDSSSHTNYKCYNHQQQHYGKKQTSRSGHFTTCFNADLFLLNRITLGLN
ncbi:hypothetical protein J4Q44_G00043090, partial [Coregonus suidteri]